MCQGLYKQMVEVFKGLGVEAVPGVGQPFDPNVHEAIMRELNDSMPDGTVLQEFRRGFKLGKSLLRPGMVKVCHLKPQLDICLLLLAMGGLFSGDTRLKALIVGGWTL